MRAKVTSTSTGAVLLESVLVVTIHDGRLGFAVPVRDAAGLPTDDRITLSGAGASVVGVATVVRSGTAYEEVLGRCRAMRGRSLWWTGHRSRGRLAVVLVRVVG